MTILIGIALSDVIVVMADGETADVIVPLRETLALAASGPNAGTELATAELRRFAPKLAPNLLSELKRVCFGGVSHVKALDAAEGRAAVPVKIGMLAAGFDSHGAFIAHAQYGDGLDKPQGLVARALGTIAFTVVGGDEAGGQAHLAGTLAELFRNGKRPDGDAAQLASSLVDAGAKTIRFVAKRNGSVGERIQYRTLRRGQPADTGAL